MAQDRKMFTGGMDKDTEERLVQKGDYRYALNCRIGTSDQGNLGAVENVKGTAEVVFTLPAGTNRTIGVYNDDESNRVIYFVWNSNGDDSILEYDIESNSVNTILQNNIINLDYRFHITGINVVDKDLLYWTDNFNPPRKINIKKAKAHTASGGTDSEGYSSILANGSVQQKEQYLDAIKYMPWREPTYEFKYDEQMGLNEKMKNGSYQFRYRWIYDDNESSAWSPISQVKVQSGDIEELFFNYDIAVSNIEGDIWENNAGINITTTLTGESSWEDAADNYSGPANESPFGEYDYGYVAGQGSLKDITYIIPMSEESGVINSISNIPVHLNDTFDYWNNNEYIVSNTDNYDIQFECKLNIPPNHAQIKSYIAPSIYTTREFGQDTDGDGVINFLDFLHPSGYESSWNPPHNVITPDTSNDNVTASCSTLNLNQDFDITDGESLISYAGRRFSGNCFPFYDWVGWNEPHDVDIRHYYGIPCFGDDSYIIIEMVKDSLGLETILSTQQHDAVKKYLATGYPQTTQIDVNVSMNLSNISLSQGDKIFLRVRASNYMWRNDGVKKYYSESRFRITNPILQIQYLGTASTVQLPIIKNSIELKYDTGSELVKHIEIAVRDMEIGANYKFYEIENLDKDQLSIPDNTQKTVKFKGDVRMRKYLADSDSARNYDFLPKKAKAQEYLSNNRIAYANIVEGFEPASKSKNNKEKINYIIPAPTRVSLKAHYNGLNRYVEDTVVYPAPAPNNSFNPYRFHDDGIAPNYQIDITKLAESYMPSTEPVFKRGGKYRFGLVYFDRAGRASMVNEVEYDSGNFIDWTVPDDALYIPWYNTLVSTNHYDGNSNSYVSEWETTLLPPTLYWDITHTPPKWATHFQWVRTKNLAQDWFIQGVVGWDPEGEDYWCYRYHTAWDGETYFDKYEDVINSANGFKDVKFIDITVNNLLNYNDDELLGRTPEAISYDQGLNGVAEGDRLRMIGRLQEHDEDPSINAGPNATYMPKNYICYREELDFEIVKVFHNDVNGEQAFLRIQGDFEKLNASTMTDGLSNYSNEDPLVNMMFEIYREGNYDDVEDVPFFEFGETKKIIDPHTNSRRHAGDFFDYGYDPLFLKTGGYRDQSVSGSSVWTDITNFSGEYYNGLSAHGMFGARDIVVPSSTGGNYAVYSNHIPSHGDVWFRDRIFKTDSVTEYYSGLIAYPNIISAFDGAVTGIKVYDPHNNDYVHFDEYTQGNGRVHFKNDRIGEEHRPTSVRWSDTRIQGTNINQLNTFYEAAMPSRGVTSGFVDYNVDFGSIQKLVSRDIDLVVLHEDKTCKVLVDKNIATEMGGGHDLVLTPSVLSDEQAYKGDYGVGLNPESVVNASNTIYFSDLRRGVVMKLGGDGFTGLSPKYMHSYFTKKSVDLMKKGGNISVYGVFDKEFMEYIISYGAIPVINGDTPLPTHYLDGYQEVTAGSGGGGAAY